MDMAVARFANGRQVTEAVKQAEQAQYEAEAPIRAKLKELARCPAGFDWHRDGDGWRLSGRKIWTTNAHHSQAMIALVRTSGGPEDRHKGLSQVLVDLSLPGVEIRRIADMTGEAHFNEVTFDDEVTFHD